tara:strand:+ start:508 stop:1005 length:498 start_codon:yes stop_codon:yes gene_type:complete
MIIDATFWVAVSFFIFIGLLIYFKIPNRVETALNEKILILKNQIQDAEKLKDEAKNILSENEKRLSNSKNEIKSLIKKTNEEVEQNILKVNNDFHKMMEIKKLNSELKIKQMKVQTIKEIKNASVKIAIMSVEKLIKNSMDKSKLDKIYMDSIEETKLALKRKSG